MHAHHFPWKEPPIPPSHGHSGARCAARCGWLASAAAMDTLIRSSATEVLTAASRGYSGHRGPYRGPPRSELLCLIFVLAVSAVSWPRREVRGIPRWTGTSVPIQERNGRCSAPGPFPSSPNRLGLGGQGTYRVLGICVLWHCVAPHAHAPSVKLWLALLWVDRGLLFQDGVSGRGVIGSRRSVPKSTCTPLSCSFRGHPWGSKCNPAPFPSIVPGSGKWAEPWARGGIAAPKRAGFVSQFAGNRIPSWQVTETPHIENLGQTCWTKSIRHVPKMARQRAPRSLSCVKGRESRLPSRRTCKRRGDWRHRHRPGADFP